MSDDVHRWTVPCGECGEDTEHMVTSVLCEDCVKDKYGFPELDELTEERVIPESELRELVQEWRNNTSWCLGDQAGAFIRCADELEALLDGEGE